MHRILEQWLRHPLVAAIAEFAVLAIPLNLAYGFVMGIVYRLDALSGLAFALFAALVAGNAYRLYARYVAQRDARELVPARARDLLYGALLGAGLIALALALIAAGGHAQISTGGALRFAALPGVAVLAGTYEELIARGVVLRSLENVFGSEIALALSAALFGWLHLGNPHATPLSVAAVGIEGGVMLGAVYFFTRSLWWTIGIHAAWNFTQTTVFGIADSGNAGHGWLHTQIDGPIWLSGGEFGIEASAVTTVVCGVVAAIFLARAYRAKRIVPPLWEHRQK